MSRPVAETPHEVKDKTFGAHKLMGRKRLVTEVVGGTVLFLPEVPWAWGKEGKGRKDELYCFYVVPQSLSF